MGRTKRSKDFYFNQIKELIMECTHNEVFDSEEFNNKISGLQAAALVDGLCPIEFEHMINQTFKGDSVKDSKKVA